VTLAEGVLILQIFLSGVQHCAWRASLLPR
jgi:hypothetical protein